MNSVRADCPGIPLDTSGGRNGDNRHTARGVQGVRGCFVFIAHARERIPSFCLYYTPLRFARNKLKTSPDTLDSLSNDGKQALEALYPVRGSETDPWTPRTPLDRQDSESGRDSEVRR